MVSKSTISYIQSLKQKKYRQKYDKFILEGEKIILEGLNDNSISFDSIYCLPEKSHLLDNINENYNIINAKQMHKLSNMKSPPGIFAVANCKLSLAIKDLEPAKVNLYLENINDPGNLGTVIRSAEWFGFVNIIASHDTVELYNPKVIQASMGSFARVNYYVSTLQELKAQFSNVDFVSTSLQGENLFNYELEKPIFLMIGNESHGLSDEANNLASNKIRIPSHPRTKAESLNAAIATSIVLSYLYGNL